jgi:hypothetical protein
MDFLGICLIFVIVCFVFKNRGIHFQNREIDFYVRIETIVIKTIHLIKIDWNGLKITYIVEFFGRPLKSLPVNITLQKKHSPLKNSIPLEKYFLFKKCFPLEK